MKRTEHPMMPIEQAMAEYPEQTLEALELARQAQKETPWVCFTHRPKKPSIFQRIRQFCFKDTK